MNRILFTFLLTVLILGCKTAPPDAVEAPARDTSPAHTVDDLTRRYSASLETVFEVCKLALEDIGADHLKPKFEMKGESATITAATRTRLYGLLLFGSDGYTDVMLIIEDKSTKDSLKKSVFDEFWAAVESHL